ncbi:MAG: chemotaxis protein CheD [Acidobacteria bacterium]|nr:chemotaxis protein CheD [Acidobacteriota bacterium]
MATLVVGISDCRCTNDPNTDLVTYALGSCIGVAALDSQNGVGGLLHFLLPDSRQDQTRAQEQPAMYADSGIPHLIRSMEKLGAERSKIRVRLAGGARMMTESSHLAVGKRNQLAARRVLWQMGVMVEMEAVGGSASRTMGLRTGKKEFWLQSSGTVGQPASPADRPATAVMF